MNTPIRAICKSSNLLSRYTPSSRIEITGHVRDDALGNPNDHAKGREDNSRPLLSGHKVGRFFRIGYRMLQHALQIESALLGRERTLTHRDVINVIDIDTD